MSNSNSTHSSRNAAVSAAGKGIQPTPAFDPQRSNAFQRALDRLSHSDGKDQGNGSTQIARDASAGKLRLDDQKNAGGEQQFGDDSDQRDDIQASLGAGGAAVLRAGKVAAMPQSAPELPPEHLNRIAAAIQELVVQGGNAQYHLQLAAGTATISGAVLGQDAAGKLTVQLIANAVLPPTAIQQLQQRLADRLKDRNLRLGLIKVSDGNPEPKVEGRDRQGKA
jgi:hypothetical protein